MKTDLIVPLTPENVIEIIMAQHWDMVACDCWICNAGRYNGLGATRENLPHNRKDDLGYVRVDGCWMSVGNDAWGRIKR